MIKFLVGIDKLRGYVLRMIIGEIDSIRGLR
jgi:hypothetical protein